MTTIYLMRHGETDWNRQERMQGRTDCPLNVCGWRQAAEAKKRFGAMGVTFDRVYSSTLSRAAETARIVSGAPEGAVETDPDLVEMGMGRYEGVLFRDLPEEMFRFFADPEHAPCPEGMEPIPQMRERIGRFLEKLRRMDPGGTVLVVAHGAAMRVLLGQLMGENWIEGWRMPIGNCSVYRTELKDGAYSRPERVTFNDAADTVEQRADRVLKELDRLIDGRDPVILAIDGRCGAGKTTLAAELARRTGYPVVHMDDFYLQRHQRTPERLATPGGNVDHERFREEVLIPLRSGGKALVRRYDCQTGTFGEPVPVPESPVVIVEGSYACHAALRDAYDLRVFLNVAPDVQRARILERNGPEKAEEFRTRWIPLEELYIRAGVPKWCELYME